MPSKKKPSPVMPLWRKKWFKIAAICIGSIAMLVVAFNIYSYFWYANYHKDDLRDRPINGEFVYIGRNYIRPDLGNFGLFPISGYYEILYYTTDVAPEDIAAALPGSWTYLKTTRAECLANASLRTPCHVVHIADASGGTYYIDYYPRDYVEAHSKHRGFPLKNESRRYYVGIADRTMKKIKLDNVEPSLRD